MQPLHLSSGDLVVDRRASYAEMLFDSGDAPAASELMRETLTLVPDWIAGWYRLGEMLWQAGSAAAATDAWREVLRLDPQDRLGATLRLDLAGALDGLDTPPIAFVETLFDQYAPEFDSSLVERLDYRVPQLLAEAIDAAVPGSFAHVVDLGCGTGLMAERLYRKASFIDGVDVSAGMLKRAEAKQIYGRLTQADINGFDLPEGTDLVTAADVFMYVGAMETVVARIAAALPEGGHFAFSVEHHGGGDGFVLRETRRYAHSRAYVADVLARAGLEVVSLEAAPIRTDRGAPIEGLIVVARRSLAVAAPVEVAAGLQPKSGATRRSTDHVLFANRLGVPHAGG